jgi:hypothetical protein
MKFFPSGGGIGDPIIGPSVESGDRVNELLARHSPFVTVFAPLVTAFELCHSRGKSIGLIIPPQPKVRGAMGRTLCPGS